MKNSVLIAIEQVAASSQEISASSEEVSASVEAVNGSIEFLKNLSGDLYKVSDKLNDSIVKFKI
jgi:methyl-accepting chemotaxis protein